MEESFPLIQWKIYQPAFCRAQCREGALRSFNIFRQQTARVHLVIKSVWSANIAASMHAACLHRVAGSATGEGTRRGGRKTRFNPSVALDCGIGSAKTNNLTISRHPADIQACQSRKPWSLIWFRSEKNCLILLPWARLTHCKRIVCKCSNIFLRFVVYSVNSVHDFLWS